LADVPASDFPEAEFGGEDEEESEWVSVTVCTESEMKATPFCPHTETRSFRRDDAPTVPCNIHNTQAQLVKVPGVTGMNESEALATIRGAGLNPAVNYAYSSTASKGTVIGQSPLAGTSVSSGSSVAITVSQGESSRSSVPGVVGMTETAAKETLSAAGLTYKVVYSPVDPSQVGIVISQFPGAGATAVPGSQVIITVGKGAGT
jgi:beta-lactam-binding protein with PASTA domain